MTRKLLVIAVSIMTFMMVASACTPDDDQNVQESSGEMAIEITSSAFTESEMIPKKYSCDADYVSPAISWAGLPEDTMSLALIVDDPDAPAGTWVHWVLYNIPADQNALPEGVKGVGIEGKNTSGKTGYGGPCPPKGPAHRYFFRLFALDTTLDVKAGLTKSELEQAMQGHILAQGQLMGKYQR
jgi:Raf kinase inhibitor-like YbhB/YbcL family protein